MKWSLMEMGYKKILLNTVYKTSKNYKKYFAMVDSDVFDEINQYKWNCWSRGKINTQEGTLTAG